MSPRPGGEADKFGARYEGAWTIWRVLEILSGSGTSVTVEAAGELEDGAEFLYERALDGAVEAHQVKRQQGNANGWTVKSLRDLEIWANAKQHIEKNREFHFVSTTPATKLNELADRARRSASPESFIRDGWLTGELKPQFDELAQPDVYGSPAEAWRMLRGVFFHWLDEDSLVNHNAGMSGLLLEGASGRLAAVGIGDLLLQHLGTRLGLAEIERELIKYGLNRTTPARSRAWATATTDTTDNWQASVRRELLSPAISRAEASTLVGLMTEPDTPITFLVGSAGGGKSAILMQAVDILRKSSIPVLGFRLDRVGQFNNTRELGQALGLKGSPVAALASVAKGGPCVLVIDQLDAVSLASGRIPTSFGAVEDLVREANAFPNMHISLVCRQFDVDNDYRIRTLREQLKAESVTVVALTDGEVNNAVDAMGLDSSTLSNKQRSLLKLPLHLVLLSEVADEAGALKFESTAHLFDAYWRRKRQMIEARKPDVHFMEVMSAVTTAISHKQQLSVSDAVLDARNLAKDGDAFISEHVLIRDGSRLAFFHEAFFDYAFARQWAESEQTLVSFLTGREQELFRRAQVRQILHHLRARDYSRYLTELRSTLLSAEVRFHIKDALLGVLTGFPDLSSEELQIVLDALEPDEALATRIWRELRSDSWFTRLDSEGYLTLWLDSSESVDRDRAVQILGSAARTQPDRVAAILAPYSEYPDYFDWVFWVVRFANLHESRSLFEHYLTAIRSGAAAGRQHVLWISVRTLADHQPAWAIALLRAYYVEWPDGLRLDETGKVRRLDENDHSLSELIQKAAASEPWRFIAILLPYMLDVMEATANLHQAPPGFPADPHFSHHDEEVTNTSDADDALLVAMRSAVQAIVRDNPRAAKPTLETLASLRLSSAQSLLYLGLIEGGAEYADWSAALLLEGVDRLFCGTMSNSVWVTRQLIETIAPLISQGDHSALEDEVRDLRFRWEGRGGGHYAFTLLSALRPTMLSAPGLRKLQEYQRKFGADQPLKPVGVTGGWIGPPVPREATPHMSNRNWLQAIIKHDTDKTDYDRLTGGARELANLLQQQAKSDPIRFAAFAEKLTPTMNPAYGDAILIGIGEADAIPSSADQSTIFAAVRHIAGLGQSSNDRWLGYSLRHYLQYVPLDLVEAVRERALSASDPVVDRLEDGYEGQVGERLRSQGMNSARGSAAEELGNLLVYDVDGSRTEVVEPILSRLASDPVLAVRSQVAHTIASALRFARQSAIIAFSILVEADDALLASRLVQRLMLYLGNGGDVELVLPVIERMVTSNDYAVRQGGGALAVVAALDWSSPSLLGQIMAGVDAAARKGVAQAAAARQSGSRNAKLAVSTLSTLFDDSDAAVRKTAAAVTLNLRGHALAPYRSLLVALIDSASYEAATPQLFLTLQHAPDNVGYLALRAAQRFIEVFGPAAGDMQTAAAGDTHYVIDLVLRGLVQSRDEAERAALLDVVDSLFKIGAYGVLEAVEDAGR